MLSLFVDQYHTLQTQVFAPQMCNPCSYHLTLMQHVQFRKGHDYKVCDYVDYTTHSALKCACITSIAFILKHYSKDSHIDQDFINCRYYSFARAVFFFFTKFLFPLPIVNIFKTVVHQTKGTIHMIKFAIIKAFGCLMLIAFLVSEKCTNCLMTGRFNQSNIKH